MAFCLVFLACEEYSWKQKQLAAYQGIPCVTINLRAVSIQLLTSTLPICLQALGMVYFSPLKHTKIGYLMKHINIYFAYQMKCLKALCLAVTCTFYYLIYHWLLAVCAHEGGHVGCVSARWAAPDAFLASAHPAIPTRAATSCSKPFPSISGCILWCFHSDPNRRTEFWPLPPLLFALL